MLNRKPDVDPGPEKNDPIPQSTWIEIPIEYIAI